MKAKPPAYTDTSISDSQKGPQLGGALSFFAPEEAEQERSGAQPDRRPMSKEHRRKNMQQLTGKPYAQVLLECLSSALALPNGPGKFETMTAIVQDVCEAYRDGEFAKFKRRKTADLIHSVRIVALVEIEKRRLGVKPEEAVRNVALELDVAVKTIQNYCSVYQSRRPEFLEEDPVMLYCVTDIGRKVESELRKHVLSVAVGIVAKQERLRSNFVRSAYLHAQRLGFVK